MSRNLDSPVLTGTPSGQCLLAITSRKEHGLFKLVAASQILLSLCLIDSAFARTWEITADGLGDAPTIQTCIDSAAAGDTVVVGPGTYNEILSTTKRIALISSFGAEQTVLDGGRQGTVIELSAGGIVQGFTIRNGVGTLGGGILIDPPGLPGAGGVISNNIIEDNSSTGSHDSDGGGIYLGTFTGNVIVSDNIIRRNLCEDAGGGIFASGGVIIIANNDITDNVALVSGGGIHAVGSTIEMNLIAGNMATHFGGGISGAAEIRHNTIVSNYTNNGIHHGAGTHVTGGVFENNIFAGNGKTGAGVGSGLFCSGPLGFSIQVSCNDAWGNAGPDYIFNEYCDTAGLGNISLDPRFCDSGNGDYRLSDDSPCAPNASSCELIGRYSVACGMTDAVPTSWGRIKSKYNR